MKLKSLNSIEKIEKEEVSFVSGGTAAGSKRWDSKEQDSKKHDTYTKLDSASSSL